MARSSTAAPLPGRGNKEEARGRTVGVRLGDPTPTSGSHEAATPEQRRHQAFIPRGQILFVAALRQAAAILFLSDRKKYNFSKIVHCNLCNCGNRVTVLSLGGRARQMRGRS